MAEALLSETTLKRRGLFDPKAVQRFIERDRQGRLDGAYTIFALMCIELWAQIFVDQPVPPTSQAIH
jgi:asparagine synthase (glutamine-hydrolysing)